MYYWIGNNFMKKLGSSGTNHNAEFKNFYFPLYLNNGGSFSGKFHINKIDSGDEYDVFYTITAVKDGDKWVERFYSTSPINYKIKLRELNATDYSLISNKIIKGDIE